MGEVQIASVSMNKVAISQPADVQELNHPDEPCPPMTTWLPRADDDETDDEDIEVGGQTQTYRCPMTLRPLEDAMTWYVCLERVDLVAASGLTAKYGVQTFIFWSGYHRSRQQKPEKQTAGEMPSNRLQRYCYHGEPAGKEFLAVDGGADCKQNPTLQKRANEAERRKKRREEEADDNESDE